MSSTISERIKTGLDLHQSGRLQDAESIYRSILAEQPQHPDALHLLGVVALQCGQCEDAAELIESAIKVKPDEPEFYNMCGEAYRALHKNDLAIARYRQALTINPDFAGAHNNLGNVYMALGQFEDAIASYQKAIVANPDFPISHNNLGIALKEIGRPDEAIAHYERALAIAPDYAEAMTNLGNALQKLGRLDEAVAHHTRALAVRPDYAAAHSNLGNALKELGQAEEAILHYRQALDIQPGFAMAHYNLGIALDELGQPDQAAAHYEQALAINPDYAEAHHNLANALDELGRLDDAVAHYERAIAIKPDYAEAHRNLTRIRPDEKRVSAIEVLLESPSLSNTDAIHCHFALGNIYHHAKSSDSAFKHFKEGNTLKRATISYDPRNFSAFVDRLIATYSRNYVEEVAAGGSDSELPVFILGMPRSGTSLIEQIVSSHPQVYGAGELAAFGRFEKTISEQGGNSEPYPECMARTHKTVSHEFAFQYLDDLKAHSRDALRVTDKMPDNFMRVGLIKTLFPKARIIHCQRNALDTCTSNFLNYFATGNEYSFDLGELGQYYLDYERLMAHWDELFSSELLNVRYEELVLNQEKISRQLIEYIGLEWDQRCLDFHQNDRAVHNFSSMQVRQPIYAGSINRWKQYEKQLAPLIELLPHAASNMPI